MPCFGHRVVSDSLRPQRGGGPVRIAPEVLFVLTIFYHILARVFSVQGPGERPRTNSMHIPRIVDVISTLQKHAAERMRERSFPAVTCVPLTDALIVESRGIRVTRC